MLRGLRKASSNWLGKVVMAAVVGFLVISFAIWGIGDIFRGFGRSTVAKVGRTEITIDQFRQLYSDRLQEAGRRFGRPISLDQARTSGLDRQLISQVIGEVALDERIRSLRLGVSDSEIARRITSDPSFQGTNGRFDRTRFEQLIRQAGYSEQRFVADQRQQTLRRQLTGTIVGGSVLPKAAVEAANRYYNEQRSIEYVLLDRAKAGEIPEPSAEELAKYFEERRILFRAPEYRKIVIVSLLPTEQARWIEISDADLKSAYEERQSRYTIPERRAIQQIVFQKPEEAAAAAERIGKGETFEAIATERGLSAADLEMGTAPMAKGAIIDRAIADAAFALKEGEVSAPAQGNFGTALLRVTKIEPERVRPLEEVAGALKQELAAERAKREMNDLFGKIEDERSIGKTLAEAAETLKLAARTLEVDRSGRTPAAEVVKDVPDAERLLAGAFTTDPGVEHDPIQVEGGYVWYDVTGITQARERTLDEVKAQVAARWRDDEIGNRLRAKAAELLEKIKGGTTLADLAAAESLKLEARTEIKRGEPQAPLSARAIGVIFRTAKDAVASAEAAEATEQLVLRVTDVAEPKADLDSAASKQLQEALSRTLLQDILGEYFAELQDNVGVSINQTAMRQVITGTATPADD